MWAVGTVRGSHGQASLAQRLCPSQPSISGFVPEVVTTSYGTGIAWSVPDDDGGTYRLVDATGLGLFDSGPLTATDTFALDFPVSGTYAVTDVTSGTTQTIRVRPAARERSRLGAGTIRVIWAAGRIPTGLVADVQVRRPGRGPWGVLAWGTDRITAFFAADAGAGRYAFRARLRDPGTGASSDWSPPAHVTIG